MLNGEGRTMAQARDAGNLYHVKGPGAGKYGACFPAAETHAEVLQAVDGWAKRAGRPVPEGTVFTVWNTDGRIGCEMHWNPTEIVFERAIHGA